MGWEAIAQMLFGALLNSAFDWVRRRLNSRRGIRIETVLEPGPISRKHGFTETAVKITISNESGARLGIRDIRLMFSGGWGASVAPQAPIPRSHAQLPASLDSGTAANWYIPAEKLSELLQSLSGKNTPSNRKATLRPRFITVTGRTYEGSRFQFSMNPDSHWSL